MAGCWQACLACLTELVLPDARSSDADEWLWLGALKMDGDMTVLVERMLPRLVGMPGYATIPETRTRPDLYTRMLPGLSGTPD